MITDTEENTPLSQSAQTDYSHNTCLTTPPVQVFLPNFLQTEIDSLFKSGCTTYQVKEETCTRYIKHALETLTIHPESINGSDPYTNILEADVKGYQTLLGRLHALTQDINFTATFKRGITTLYQHIQSYVEACHPLLYQKSQNQPILLNGNNPLVAFSAPSAPPPPPDDLKNVPIIKLFHPFIIQRTIDRLTQGSYKIPEGLKDPAKEFIKTLYNMMAELAVKDDDLIAKIRSFFYLIKKEMTIITQDPNRKNVEASFLRALDQTYDCLLTYTLQASPDFAKKHTQILNDFYQASRFVTCNRLKGVACAALYPFSLLYCACCCDLGPQDLACDSEFGRCLKPNSYFAARTKIEHEATFWNGEGAGKTNFITSTSVKFITVRDDEGDKVPPPYGCLANAVIYFLQADITDRSLKEVGKEGYFKR